MGSAWHDLYTDGKRLNRIIRILVTKMKKATDDDKIIRYANAIAYITAKKVEITDKVLGVEFIVKNGEKRYNQTHSERLDPSAKYMSEGR